MTASDRKLIAIFSAAHTMVHIFEQALPALFPLLMAEMALSITGASTMQFGLALAFGGCAIPAGMLAARWGAGRVVQLYLVIAAVGAVTMAVAPSPALLAVGAVAIGVGLGLYHPAGTSFLTTNVRARSKAMGYHGLGGGLGVSTGPILTVGLAALLGWRMALIAYALMGLGVASLLRHVPGIMAPAAEAGGKDRLHAQPESAAPAAQPEEETDLRRFGLLLTVGTLVGFVYRGAITFLPLYLGYALAGPDEPERVALLGGVFASATLYIGMGAQWLGGQLGERYPPTILLAIGHTLSVPCLLLLARSEGYVCVIAAGLFAFGHFLAQPLGNVLVASYSSRKHRDGAFGWYFALAFGIGSLGAVVGGAVGEHFTLGTVFTLLAGVASLAVGAAWCLHVLPQPSRERAVQPAEA